MNIAFYSNRIKFDGTFLEKQGLGGSESALINLSTVWKQKYPEDKITVFNSFYRKAEEINGVIWKGVVDFKSECKNANWDVFISLREPEPLFEPYIDSKLKFFWSQDDTNEVGIQTIASNQFLQSRIDSILVISKHSYNDINRVISTPLFLLRNGYRKDWIDLNQGERIPLAIYTSTPFRGLDVLAEIWPNVVVRYNERIGDKTRSPKLKVITGMSLYQQPETNFQDLYNFIDHLAFVERHSAVPQRQLYDHLKYSSVMLYPNHFPETGCMAVTEALANNLWIVTTNLAALGEQVIDGKNGYLINGDAHSKRYKEEFVEKAADALVNCPVPDNSGLIFSWQEQCIRLRNYIYNLLE
jgi:glycosyltransferase involved in cell wall biosynthesis